ncbi:co-chaperone GroES, partial [Patescibacteria group bacterium]|nr:co-chaperone GroES [Patescibacteria group bacterium]
VKKGDIVLFAKYGPSEIKIDKKEYLIAREEDILAILEK